MLVHYMDDIAMTGPSEEEVATTLIVKMFVC